VAGLVQPHSNFDLFSPVSFDPGFSVSILSPVQISLGGGLVSIEEQELHLDIPFEVLNPLSLT
jgi:hypothetical protein